MNISDHPLSKQVNAIWDKELVKRGYDKDLNVYDLPRKIYFEIATIIDSEVEDWFEGCSASCPQKFIKYWNYQARHIKKSLETLPNKPWWKFW